MSKGSQLLGFSTVHEEVMEIGPPSRDLDKLLGLAELVDRPDMILTIKGPALQQWEDA